MRPQARVVSDMILDYRHELFSELGKFAVADAGDFQEGVRGLGQTSGHLLEGTISEDNIGRDLEPVSFFGSEGPQFFE